MTTTSQKLSALRELMSQHNLAAYFVPSTDAHQSEYVPACWERRKWLSGFTGSAGDLLVTRDDAALWTDGRYWLQAEAQLKGSGIKLMRAGKPGIPSVDDYLKGKLVANEALGADPRVLSPARAGTLEAALAARGAQLALVDTNLVDAIWRDRPQPSPSPLTLLPQRYAGETTGSKLKRLRQELAAHEAAAHVLTTLDAIAWLFNLRGRDVEYNPVAIAYALVTPDTATLFVRPEKVSPAVARKLAPAVTVRPYDEIEVALRMLAADKARVWVDKESANRWVVDLLAGCRLVTLASPVYRMKAKKNATEVTGTRAAHLRDGVAMVRFLHWLSHEVPKGQVTELSAEARLEEFRAEGELFQGLSFHTISGYAEHGAVIHYQSTEQSNVPLKSAGIYLIDSGAQYLDGTTDITRTVWLGGKPSRKQQEHYTRVLKGHIALARVKFPAGVRGMRLDTLARLSLWEAGLDFNHGTGHGVGAYLNVHEGPQAISPTRCIGVPLEPGNIQSNEPGYYEAGAYGIRIENLVLVVEDERLTRKDHPWLRFDTLTLCPIETKLIDRRLLTPDERAWLNDYHARVYKTLAPHVDRPVRHWLKRATARI